LNNWVYKKFKSLLTADYFANLKLETTIKEKYNTRNLFPEEIALEEKMIADVLDFSRLYIDQKATEFFVIKDMELSKFPHNLFLDQFGNFIAKEKPICNVLSTEWLLTKQSIVPLAADFSKAIWLPVESGDYTLNYLNSNIEETLTEKKFSTFTSQVLASPLSADLNIVCSHGARNISEVQVVFQESNPTYNLDSIIGNGRILIFFVCHSGSMRNDFFRNNVASLVKRFIAKGYESVIAPFWALEVTIPKYWFPAFMDSFEAGNTIAQAVFHANRKVAEHYPTPTAWACLHLYGNPHLSIS
jgi:hypothetical protein